MSRGFSRVRAAASVLLSLGLVAGLAACTADPLADQYREGDNKGFVAAANGFEVVEIEAADRTDPIEFEGVLDTGDKTSSADYAGDVTVVNDAFEGQDVKFLGVNLYDGAEASQAFAKKFGVQYPSALTTVDGSIKLAFAGATPLNAVPVTLVLDKEGRVAARLIGQIEGPSILETLVRETLEES